MMNFEHAASMIRSARSVLLTTHVRPDGDALGSLAALRELIRCTANAESRSCTVETLLLSEPAEFYNFFLLEGYWLLGRQVSKDQIAAGYLDSFDLIIVADTRASRQLPDVAEALKKNSEKLLVIDHHLTGDITGACELIQTDACAAGEIIAALAKEMNWSLNPVAATALFVAVATDTGWFAFENCNETTFRLATEFIHAGAQPDLLYNQIYLNFPPARLKLLASTLGTLETHYNSRLAVIHITNEMLLQSGATRSLTENIVNAPGQIKSVIAFVLLIEQEDGSTRCSLRSKSHIDVNRIANHFGGGGHARAAGATLECPLDQAKAKIIEAFKPVFADFGD